MRRRSLTLPVCALAAALAFRAPPVAASCVGLGCGCTVAADDLNFGDYDPFSASAIDSSTEVRVECGALILGALITYEVRISSGGSGNYAARSLASGNSRLFYNLYTDAARSSIWGDGSGGSITISDGYTLTLLYNQLKIYPLYGRIPGGQNVAAGQYRDSLVISVIY